MIPPTFIFDETQESISVRAYRDRLATGLLRFLAIGTGAIALYVLISEVLTPRFADLPAVLLPAVVFAALVAPTYLLHRRFAFFSDAPQAGAFTRYATVQIAVLLVAAAFSFLAHGAIGAPHLGTGLLVFFLTVGVNFSILRRWAFASA